MQYRFKDISWYKTQDGLIPYIENKTNTKIKMILTGEIIEFNGPQHLQQCLAQTTGKQGTLSNNNFLIFWKFYYRATPFASAMGSPIEDKHVFDEFIADEQKIKKIVEKINKNYLKSIKKDLKKDQKIKPETKEQKLEQISECSKDF